MDNNSSPFPPTPQLKFAPIHSTPFPFFPTEMNPPASLIRKTIFYSRPFDPAAPTHSYPPNTHLTFFDKERGYVKATDLRTLIPTIDEKVISYRSVVVETLENAGGTFVAEAYRLSVY